MPRRTLPNSRTASRHCDNRLQGGNGYVLGKALADVDSAADATLAIMNGPAVVCGLTG
jgi:hypothetical protein